nr:MEDS domain-containing protein [Petropleomorpha daqingensis]
MTDPAGAVQADHVCWVYDDDEDFVDVARRYLEEGLARGERLLYVGEPHPADLATDDGPLADVEALIARGTLQVLDLRAGYEGSGSFTPAVQLAFYETATADARAAGYTGLCVVAEISGLAADRERRPALVRWEHLADDFMASGSGMRALCAYRSELGRQALTDVASVHPLVHDAAGGPPFRAWFEGEAITLAGALDTFGADRLERVLTGTHVARPTVTLDLSQVEFVDVGGARAIARWARLLQERGSVLELAGTSRVFRRMWRICDFDACAEVSFREPPT